MERAAGIEPASSAWKAYTLAFKKQLKFFKALY
ncbi:hypothetical protein VMF7928_00589 [Vibrio marisflavi CECT 7928]|uniref:Uncharacterized protein n=1 Tax=Vibrio marisflavi CECT 7928 TaxID=634439 RepID=A0ABN8DYE6_9VIBR|nr:hypothetical protein VMF7928_00589 [Vibrio marisflavi CECT 7928]